MPDEAHLKAIYKDLPWLVRRAVNKLKKVSPLAVNGVGSHRSDDCPIAHAYLVGALTKWKQLNREHRKKLRSNGWSRFTYNAFIQWYDDPPFRTRREEILRQLLAQ